MKRIALGALVLFIAASAFAGETRRYLVGTKRPARTMSIRSLSEGLREPAERHVREFTLIDAFAADLTAEEVSALRRSPEVRWVEPAVDRWLDATSKPGEQLIPPGMAQIRAPEAWAGRSAGEVNVAIIDSGIDPAHPELAASYAGGFHVFEPELPPMDDVSHGTHVAGIIGAANNGYGVIGVAHDTVRLWALKVVDETGRGVMDDVLTAVEWVVDKKKEVGGRWVVNMSLGGTESSIGEREVFAKAVDAGVILVASSGNTSTLGEPAPVGFPAAYPEVIAVGAVSETNTRASFSNIGPELDFVAPGVRILSTVLTGGAFLSYARVGDTIITTKPVTGGKTGSITADYVYCGLGGVNDFPAAVNGKIALIKRGVDTFADKGRRAKEAGAVAIAFFNHDDSNIAFTLLPAEDPDAKNYPWPIAVAMTLADGEALAAKGSGRMAIAYDPDDYGIKTGTSMAAPHVTGAIALLWSMAPDATPAQLVNALVTTAADLGTPGRDDIFGNGEIDVYAAARMLVPSAFGQTTGRRFLTRRRP
jgi:subtilisin family serine protease